jgi:hypothetical protein
VTRVGHPWLELFKRVPHLTAERGYPSLPWQPLMQTSCPAQEGLVKEFYSATELLPPNCRHESGRIQNLPSRI